MVCLARSSNAAEVHGCTTRQHCWAQETTDMLSPPKKPRHPPHRLALVPCGREYCMEPAEHRPGHDRLDEQLWPQGQHPEPRVSDSVMWLCTLLPCVTNCMNEARWYRSVLSCSFPRVLQLHALRLGPLHRQQGCILGAGLWPPQVSRMASCHTERDLQSAGLRLFWGIKAKQMLQ